MKRAIRFFNTTGPCNPDDHYMLPPEERLEGAQLHRYIRDNLYWVLHAPRQTGKTTFLQSWLKQINADNNGAIACYVSVERCQGIPDIERAMPALCEAIYKHAKEYNLPVPSTKTTSPASMLNDTLVHWAELTAPRALIVLFDEVDALSGEALISFLRQLRDGFMGRGVGKFPSSIALVGMREYLERGQAPFLPFPQYGTSPAAGFGSNCALPTAELFDKVSLRRSKFAFAQHNYLANARFYYSSVITNFTSDDVRRLFAQRTKETGQEITEDALNYVWEQSCGQPWLVNSLFKRATMRVLEEESRQTVTKEHIIEARQQMISARETHLESLVYRLEDAGIRKVMETLITGAVDLNMPDREGFRLAQDLGLVAVENGVAVVANPIYREVLANQMTWGTQLAIPSPEFRWQTAEGKLDMDALLIEFGRFWRENSEAWERQSNYHEAFPHLLLMAFLQRVLNGGGRIEREYAAGRGRLDLLVEYGKDRHIIEIKMVHEYDSPENVLKKGLEQITRYRDTINSAARAYLVIFDRRSGAKKLSWEERITWAEHGTVTVAGY